LKVAVPAPRAVAVTPIKDGRSPPVAGFRPPIVFPPLQVPATVAITPICKMPHAAPYIPYQYEPYIGVMHGILPPFQSLPQPPLVEGPPKVPSPIMMGTKRMNPDAEEFIPSYLRDSPKLPAAQPPVTSTENIVAVAPVERLDVTEATLPTPTVDSTDNVAEGAEEPSKPVVDIHEVDDKLVNSVSSSHNELENGTPVVEVKCVTVQ